MTTIAQRTIGGLPDTGLARTGTARWVIFVNLLAMAAIVGLTVGYLAMNSSASTKGFVIRSLEQQITDLEERKKTLSIEAATISSLNRVEDRLGEMGFVPVAQVEYMNAIGGTVAVK